MSNDIVKRNVEKDLSIIERIEYLAPKAHKTHQYKTSSVEDAAIKMYKGAEIGLAPMQSLEFVTTIQGKVELIPRGALALAYMSGEIKEISFKLERDKNGEPYSFTVTGTAGVVTHTETFTMDDARRAGLVKPGSAWTTYPQNMLKWRAIGFWIDTVLPHTQGGMKRADEFGAWVDDRGDIIEAEMVESSVVTLDDLINEFGVETVMNVIMEQFGGNAPTAQDDIEEMRMFLLRQEESIKAQMEAYGAPTEEEQVNDQPAYKVLAEDEE
jgi:hypothetical protein